MFTLLHFIQCTLRRTVNVYVRVILSERKKGGSPRERGGEARACGFGCQHIAKKVLVSQLHESNGWLVLPNTFFWDGTNWTVPLIVVPCIGGTMPSI